VGVKMVVGRGATPHIHTSNPPFVGSHIEARRYILINFKAS
jgi:hypothetical protein